MIHNAFRAHVIKSEAFKIPAFPAISYNMHDCDYNIQEDNDFASSTIAHDDFDIPTMPLTSPCNTHRERCLKYLPEISACVSRLMTPSEIKVSKRALQAIMEEGNTLRDLGTWDESSVCERSEVATRARRSGKTVHFYK